jgi:ELWxxDGT repeat protein
MVKDINPGSSSSSLNSLTDVNGTLFFRASDGSTGYELWKSDGTQAGTSLVKDIWPNSSSSSPNNFIAVNGTLFFSANDGLTGTELWKSDGTQVGTVLAREIYFGKRTDFYFDMSISANSSSPSYLTYFKGMLVFRASDPEGQELWKYHPN